MTSSHRHLPDVSTYIQIIDMFIERSTSASDFEMAFLNAMKAESRILGEPVYPILQELFEDADAYVSQPDVRTEPEDLDDEQLRACAKRARDSLRRLGFD